MRINTTKLMAKGSAERVVEFLSVNDIKFNIEEHFQKPYYFINAFFSTVDVMRGHFINFIHSIANKEFTYKVESDDKKQIYTNHYVDILIHHNSSDYNQTTNREE